MSRPNEIDFRRMFEDCLYHPVVKGTHIEGYPGWDGEPESESIILKGNLFTGRWACGDRWGDAVDFLSLVYRTPRHEAENALRISYGPPLTAFPRGGRFSELFDEWSRKVDEGVVFDSGAAYTPAEIAALKGRPVEQLRTVHEIKRLLADPRIDAGLQRILADALELEIYGQDKQAVKLRVAS
jgi:hypothetical protein